MPEQAFQRQVVIELGTEGGSGTRFKDLRVSFSCKFSRASTPNTATVSIWNLTPDSVALLQQPRSVIRLLAGYDVPRLLFQGAPVKNGVKLSREGPDRILEVEAQDGGRQYRDAVVSLSMSGRVTFAQAFALVAEQLGLPAGTQRLPSGADAITFPSGLTINSPARDALTRLAEASNAEWFITDGALQFVGSGEDVGTTALLFSATAGNLIGSPRQREDGGVEFRALLDASARPGSLVSLESEAVSGLFVAHDVEFEGDSGFATEFYVTITAYPRGAAPAKTSTASSKSGSPPTAPASGPDTPNDADVLQDLARAIAAGLRCHLPAQLTAHDAATQTCSAQPTIRAKFKTPDGGIQERDYPPIHNVPVCWMQSGDNSIVLPMVAGDEVLLHFGDRSIDEWRTQASGTVSARDPRLHDITDAFAEPVLRRPANPLTSSAYAPGALVIRGNDIRLGSSAPILPANQVVLLKALSDLATAFSSWVVVAGDGGAALKTVLSALIAGGWPANGAATKVKAE